MSSCYSRYYTYKGNIHQEAVGKSKNDILRSYGPPERSQDDGAGGTIMIYEKFTQTTITNAGAATYGRSATEGGVVYGNGGIIGGSQTQSGSISSMNGISQTSTDKSYCYLFLNQNNQVYDFKTNYGAQYSFNKCFQPVTTWLGVGMSCLLIYPAIVTIPWATVAHIQAKKKGIMCK